MKKPKIVEVMGLPYTGKSILTRILTRILDSQGFKVTMIEDQIRAAASHVHDLGDAIEREIEMNLWAVSELKKNIIEARRMNQDLILVERGGWALHASLKTFLNLNLVKKKRQRKRARQGSILAMHVVRDEDFFILMEIPAKISLEREKNVLGIAHPGTIMNLDFLSGLEDAYRCLKGEKLPRGRTKIIDGQEELQKVQEKTLKTLVRLLKKGSKNSSESGQQRRERGIANG